ncbi:lysophospholipase L1-like esterase [Alteromonadaceae bacterium 2753L.S.0a.02]|nr:lysophospholipase L1-like esterase [Alteromonadaceae bacterium 2753L.S.0a.02]
MKKRSLLSISITLVAVIPVIFTLAACLYKPSDHKQANIWTTTWATATEDIKEGFWMSKGHFPPKPLQNDTLRMFMRTSIGGDKVRIKFSNVFGQSPVIIRTAHLAEAVTPNASASNGGIKTNTDIMLTFSGKRDVVIPPGSFTYSDPVVFDLSPLEVVSISIQYGDIDEKPITGHRGSRTTSFFGTGNQVSQADMIDAVKKDVWYTVTAIEVLNTPPPKAVVAIGDSITDGYGTEYNYHTRWTDYLAERLVQNPDTKPVAVANAGIGGAGSSLSVEHFQRDVLDINGAHWVIIFVGVNDIVYGKKLSASRIIKNYTKMANLAHEQGLKVYGATIIPMGTHSEISEKEFARRQINEWIRTTAVKDGIYDDFIDFDRVARDPERPQFLLSKYAVDDLHMNKTGYKALADAVELRLFVSHEQTVPTN